MRKSILATCMCVALAPVLVGCIGDSSEDIQTDGTQSEPAQQVVTITARDIAALSTSESLRINLLDNTRFRFDSTQGTLDLSRVLVTDISGRSSRMDQWLAISDPDFVADLPAVFEVAGQPYVAPPSAPGVAAQELTIIYIIVKDANGNIVGVIRIIVDDSPEEAPK